MADFFLSNLKSTLDNCITELDEIHSMFCRNPESDFTRNRKLSFREYIQFMLQMQSKSVSNAVNICRAYLKHDGNETESMLLIQKYLTPVKYNRKYPIHLRPKRNRDFMYRVAQISLPLYCIMRQICNLSFCHTQKNDLNSSYICFLRISAPKKYSIS